MHAEGTPSDAAAQLPATASAFLPPHAAAMSLHEPMPPLFIGRGGTPPSGII